MTSEEHDADREQPPPPLRVIELSPLDVVALMLQMGGGAEMLDERGEREEDRP